MKKSYGVYILLFLVLGAIGAIGKAGYLPALLILLGLIAITWITVKIMIRAKNKIDQEAIVERKTVSESKPMQTKKYNKYELKREKAKARARARAETTTEPRLYDDTATKTAAEPAHESDHQIEKDILRLAVKKDGYLTATDLALNLDLTLEESTQILNDMRDNNYCVLRVADNGTYVYQFEFLSDEQKKTSERV